MTAIGISDPLKQNQNSHVELNNYKIIKKNRKSFCGNFLVFTLKLPILHKAQKKFEECYLVLFHLTVSFLGSKLTFEQFYFSTNQQPAKF